jgi:hypothetical protein
MGRPRKKRRYRRRKHLLKGNGADVSIMQVAAAKDLQLKIRSLVMDASPDVRRVAIADLIVDLQWMAQVQEDSPPAP